MKKLFFLLVIILGLGLQSGNAQTIEINEKTVIKNEKGESVSIEKFMGFMQSGEYMIEPKKDTEGKDYILVRKATDEEKKMMSEMPPMDAESDLVGTEVNDLSLKTIDGKSITSESTKGKIVVLNFWFTSCKPCISELPELNELHEKYKDNANVVFASVTFESKERITKFLKKHDIKYPIVASDKNTISLFKINGYPTNIVIGKDGKVSYAVTGGFPRIGEAIESAIKAEL